MREEGRPIGDPVGDTQPIPEHDQRGGYFADFEDGSIYWTPQTGAHDVRGQIYQRWQELKAQGQFLEYPITDQLKTADGLAHYNHFEWGSIYAVTSTGEAYALHSFVRDKWSELGGKTTSYIYLRASTGHYVSVEAGDDLTADTDRPIQGPWETFTVCDPATGQPVETLAHGQELRLKSVSGKYLRPINGGSALRADDQTEPNNGTTFRLEKIGGSLSQATIRYGDSVALRTSAGPYWVAENGGGGRVAANSESIGLWEIFTIEFLGGGESSVLGYPTAPQEQTAAGSHLGHFEGGTLRRETIEAPLTFFQQNMALLPETWNGEMNKDYQGADREAAIGALITFLRSEQPDLVGLSECFEAAERTRITEELAAIYPAEHTLEGPQEGRLLDRNSGLLLLSRHPFMGSEGERGHQSLYRHYPAGTHWLNRGILHTRVQVEGQPTQYDIFLTQTQIPEQLAHLHRFVQAYRHPQLPALLMAGLNIDAFDGRCNGPPTAGRYQDIAQQLQPTGTLWQENGNNGKDVTAADPAAAFRPEAPVRPADDPARRQTGTRPDYFLLWPGLWFEPVYQNTAVQIVQTANNRDISDHYGLKTGQDRLHRWTIEVDRTIVTATVTLLGFHCLTKTPGLGPDLPRFTLSVNGSESDAPSSEVEVVADGDGFDYSEALRIRVAIDAPTDGLEITVTGWDKNPFTSPEPGTPFSELPDEPLGSATLRIEQDELLVLLGRSAQRTLPLLQGEAFLAGPAGEYAVVVGVGVT